MASTTPGMSSGQSQLAGSARALLGEQQQAAASGLGNLAGTLRRAARDTPGGQTARFAESAADGLERVSQALSSRDFDGLVRDAEGFARRQPAVFLGVAAVAGFLAVRFLKSTGTTSEGSPSASQPTRQPY